VFCVSYLGETWSHNKRTMNDSEWEWNVEGTGPKEDVMCDGKKIQWGVPYIVLSHNILSETVTKHRGMQLQDMNPADGEKNVRDLHSSALFSSVSLVYYSSVPIKHQTENTVPINQGWQSNKNQNIALLK